MLREPTQQFLHDTFTVGSNGEKMWDDSFSVHCMYMYITANPKSFAHWDIADLRPIQDEDIPIRIQIQLEAEVFNSPTFSH